MLSYGKWHLSIHIPFPIPWVELFEFWIEYVPPDCVCNWHYFDFGIGILNIRLTVDIPIWRSK